jgi:uncharacterized protein YndB with AHSA1/START domain
MSSGINHQVGIKALPEEIYKALIETEKFAQWWTTDNLKDPGPIILFTTQLWRIRTKPAEDIAKSEH